MKKSIELSLVDNAWQNTSKGIYICEREADKIFYVPQKVKRARLEVTDQDPTKGSKTWRQELEISKFYVRVVRDGRFFARAYFHLTHEVYYRIVPFMLGAWIWDSDTAKEVWLSVSYLEDE